MCICIGASHLWLKAKTIRYSKGQTSKRICAPRRLCRLTCIWCVSQDLGLYIGVTPVPSFFGHSPNDVLSYCYASLRKETVMHTADDTSFISHCIWREVTTIGKGSRSLRLYAAKLWTPLIRQKSAFCSPAGHAPLVSKSQRGQLQLIHIQDHTNGYKVFTMSLRPW